MLNRFLTASSRYCDSIVIHHRSASSQYIANRYYIYTNQWITWYYNYLSKLILRASPCARLPFVLRMWEKWTKRLVSWVMSIHESIVCKLQTIVRGQCQAGAFFCYEHIFHVSCSSNHFGQKIRKNFPTVIILLSHNLTKKVIQGKVVDDSKWQQILGAYGLFYDRQNRDKSNSEVI